MSFSFCKENLNGNKCPQVFHWFQWAEAIVVYHGALTQYYKQDGKGKALLLTTVSIATVLLWAPACDCGNFTHVRNTDQTPNTISSSKGQEELHLVSCQAHSLCSVLESLPYSQSLGKKRRFPVNTSNWPIPRRSWPACLVNRCTILMKLTALLSSSFRLTSSGLDHCSHRAHLRCLRAPGPICQPHFSLPTLPTIHHWSVSFPVQG